MIRQHRRIDMTQRKLKLGELVKILKPMSNNDGKSKKLLPKFTGPFRVSKVLGNDRYEVSSIPGAKITQKNYCNIWAADRIKPWISIPCSDDGNEDSTSSSSEAE